MWSYYADAHQGFVIGFNARHNFFEELTLAPVYYSTQYPTVRLH
jgi:hypothetical protein